MNHSAICAPTPSVGTPVYRRGETGHICRVTGAAAGSFTLGSGAMVPNVAEFEICFSGHLSTVPDGVAAPWLAEARRMGLEPISPAQAEERRAQLLEAQEDARAQARVQSDAAATRAAEFKIEAASKMPPDAKAVIVAELVSDRSDSMSDYWGSVTARTVILAFSTHTRDLFPELRKAALNSPETAHLHDAAEKAEHREKYSMGAGFYLKEGSRDSDGWKVKKVRLYRGAESVPVGEWSLPTLAPVAPSHPASPVAATGFTLSEHVHSTKGFRMWIAQGPRVERAEYDQLLAGAKALGGWYSRPWGGTPGGFAFKNQEAAQAFVGGRAEADTAQPIRPEPVASVGVGERLRGLADKMQGDIDHKFAGRLANTPKRQREAQSARLDGERLKRTQQGLRALADLHDVGTVPAELRGVTTKAAAFDLARGEIQSSGGYYDAGHETGQPASNTPAARAFWALLCGPTAAEREAEALQRKVEALQFANIPGFFPTPAAVALRMVEEAEIPARATILEPSAGSGAILDELRSLGYLEGAKLVAYERHMTLRQILAGKGYDLAGADFMESDTSRLVDRVLMNPPFEKGQDIDHVRRAFAHLKPGGRLVAIMSPGPFFRSDAKSAAFREWFAERDGHRAELPADSFKASGTSVATVIVVIDR